MGKENPFLAGVREHFSSEDLEKIRKVRVGILKENLLRINPELAIWALDIKLDQSNIGDVFEECHVIVEALDKAEDKAMMIKTFLKSPKLVVSVSGIGGWGDSDRIKTRRIKENFLW